ncbi:MAG: M50 family metallopeptidase [Saprospiraceae bacterium]
MDRLGLTEGIRPETGEEKVIMVVGFIVITFVVMAAHELGHLLVGLVQGFRFELFVVGPFGVRREPDGQVRLFLNKNLGYYGGVAATSPVDDNPDNARKFAWVLLAGPIASLVFAAICFALIGPLGKPLGFVFYSGGLVSVAMFFATTIPSRTGMFFTDRKRFQRLVTPGKDRDVEVALLNMLGKFSRDGSYKNIAQSEIEILLKDDFPYIRFFGLFNMICYQLEHKGAADDSVLEEYATVASEMSPALVTSFDREITRYAEQYGT